MTDNQLGRAVSPYLLQHKDNPVHWRMWGPEALAEARAADRPILLSVGYAACHWCHVMAHESFEDPATADVMNRLFVNIKVDREERPDIDHIYMAALHALGEQGGWPLTMFLTPQAEPIWGGTYFPKEARYGRPAFVDILSEIARLYRDRLETINHNKDLILQRLRALPDRRAIALDRPLLDEAAARLLDLMDLRLGGIRGAPKFPQPSLLEFLWRAGARTGEPGFDDAVLATLRNMAQGGIYDHLGGGFARYSVDDRWLVPHFEKMLYDNAQLVELMTYAYARTADPLFRSRIEETVDWLSREMKTPEGAFASSLDADSDGHEGRFYVWAVEEVASVLGKSDADFFAQTYDIRQGGNWEGVSILNRLSSPALLAPFDEDRLADLRRRLLARRSTRNRPALDDKVLADWNGLAISALALAGATFARPDWIETAAVTFNFIAETMTVAGRVAHAYRADKLTLPGLATDYAALIRGAIALYQATFDRTYLASAEGLAATVRRHHWDADSPGYYLPADDAEALILRPRSATDEATPSATSMMAANLIRLWHLTGEDNYRRDADDIIAAASPFVAGNLFAATGLLNALDLRLGALDVTVISPPEISAEPLLEAARRHVTPNVILSLHRHAADLPRNHPAFEKQSIAGRATAYVCRGETCSLPLTLPADLARAMSGTRGPDSAGA